MLSPPAAAHDLRNQLLVVVTTAAAVLAELPPGHPHVADLESILRAAQRAQTLAGARQREQVPCLDPAASIRSWEAGFRHALGPAVGLALDVPRRLPAVGLDAGLLQDLLLNLLLNAGEAVSARPDAWVVLRARPADGGSLELEVRDNGAGMDATVLERCLLPGFTTRSRGSGLGLASVRSAAEDAGGRLCIDSRVGEGTRVVVALPALRAASARR